MHTLFQSATSVGFAQEDYTQCIRFGYQNYDLILHCIKRNTNKCHQTFTCRWKWFNVIDILSSISRLLTAFLYCSSTVSVFLSILERHKEPNEPLQALICLNKAEETCLRIQVIEVIEVLQWRILKKWFSFDLKGERLKTFGAHMHLSCLISLFFRKLWMCRKWGFQSHACKHICSHVGHRKMQSRHKLLQVQNSYCMHSM